MAYKALYRQFRPRRFCEIKDQDSVSNIIKNQVKNNRVSHAYIFAGPRGTGKTSTAKIFACALNCLSPIDGEPCLECSNCVAALNEAMPDIVEMDAASNTGVDDARALQEKINLMPVAGSHKIYIIDEVHMLSTAAFNALLKTIEEPPDYAVFILATTELRKLPKTVLSRCQRFDFKAIDTGKIKERIREVLFAIGKTAEDEAIEMIAEASEGGMRDALTILEKICSVEDNITSAGVASVLNFAESGKVRSLLRLIGAYKEKEATELVLAIIDSGIEPITLISQMISMLRDLLLASVTGSGRLAEDAAAWKKEGILRAIEVLSETERRMSFTNRPDILLESAIIRLLLPERQDSPEDNAVRMDKLEKEFADIKKNGVSVIAAVPASAETAEAEKTKKVHYVPKNASEAWKIILEYVQKQKNDKGCFGVIRNLKAYDLTETELYVRGDEKKTGADMLSVEARENLNNSAFEVLGRKINIVYKSFDKDEDLIFEDAIEIGQED